MSHAEQRLRERAPQYLCDLPRLQQRAKDGRRYAIRLGPAKFMAAGYAGDRATSHGDQVWAILGDGVVITVMYRRSSQPKTPAAFDVDEVLLWG